MKGDIFDDLSAPHTHATLQRTLDQGGALLGIIYEPNKVD